MPQNNFPDIKEAARLHQFTLLLIELFTFNCSITFTCTSSQFASPFIPKIITVLPDFHRGLISQPLQIPKFANAKWKVLVTQSCLTLHEPIDCSPPGSSYLWNSPGKNTRVEGHSLLPGIFLTQGSNSGLLHCRWIFFFPPTWAFIELMQYGIAFPYNLCASSHIL